MKAKKSKLLLIGSTIVSLFAVTVGAVATAAWFQINTVTDTLDNSTNNMVTGSTNVGVDGVTGYKFNYDELSSTETSTTDGAVIGAASSTAGNVDEDKIEQIDQPTQGVGYYMLFKNEDDKFKYTDPLTTKMSDQYSENYAFKELAVQKDDVIIIRKHTYSGEETTNTELDEFSIDGGQTSYFTYSNGTAEFTVKTTGTYHFYINYQEKITWTKQSDVGPSRLSRLKNGISGGPTHKNAASKSYVYVNISDFTSWNDYNPHCCIYFSGGDAANSSTVAFSNNVANITIPSGIKAGTIYVKRCSSGDPNNVWNSTGGNTRCEFSLYYDPALAGQTINVTDWNSGQWNITAGTYIIGEGGTIGSTNTWTILSGISMDDTPVSDNIAQESLTINANTIFRVFSTTSNPTSSSNVQYKSWDDTFTNEAGHFTNSGDNKKALKTFYGTVYLNASNKIYINVGSHAASLNYKRYGDSTGTTPIAADTSTWRTLTPVNFTSGTAPSLPNDPSVDGYVWCGHWYTENTCTNEYDGTTTYAADTNFYTKFVLPTYTITIQLAKTKENSTAIDDKTGSTTTGSIASNETLNSSWLDTNSSTISYSSSNYVFVGYYHAADLSDNNISGDTAITTGAHPTGAETIYKVYRPKASITIDVVYTGTGANISKVLGTDSSNTIGTKYTSGTSWTVSDLDTLTSSYTYSNSNYYFAGYWNDKDNSGNLSNQITSSYSVGSSDTIYKVYRQKITINVVGVYVVDNTNTKDSGKNTVSTSFKLSGTTVSTTTINNTVPTYDTTHYTKSSYYRNGPSTLSTVINSTGFEVNDTTTIYVKLQPKTEITVTYNYRFFVKNAVTGNEESYTNISTDSGTFKDGTEQYTGIYYRHAYNTSEHAPKSEAYAFDSTAKAGYKFEPVGFYNEAACTSAYTQGTKLESNKTLYVKMVASYHDMHASIRVTNNEANDYYWRSTDLGTNKIQLHFTQSVTASYGTAQAFYDLSRGEDGIFNFRITNGVGFQICNNHAGGARTTYDYTSEITSAANDDSYGHHRGVCNVIQVNNDVDGSNNRKWQWSNYYGGGARSANVCSTDSSLRNVMSRGDGTTNMYVYDAGLALEEDDILAIKFDNGGEVSWYDYDDLGNDASRALFKDTSPVSATEEDLTGSGDDTVNVVDKALKVKAAGTYNIYLNAQGKVYVVSVPADKGEGFYIMPYTDNTASYTGGTKMRNTGQTTVGKNVAYYKFFETTADNQQFYIRSYINGVDGGVIADYGSSTDLATMSDGVLTIKDEGRYDIYIKKFETHYTIYLNKIDTSTYNFFSLNKFDGTASSAKNTTLVLEVKCHATSAAATKMGATIVRTTTSGGISRYLKFNVFCSSEQLGNACYKYMRDNYLSTAESFASNDSKTLELIDDAEGHEIAANSAVTDYYYVYILIDYQDGVTSSTLKSNLTGLTNDFRIIVTGSN